MAVQIYLYVNYRITVQNSIHVVPWADVCFLFVLFIRILILFRYVWIGSMCVCVYVVGLIVCIKTYAYAFHSTNPLVCCAVIPYSALIYKCRLFHAKYTFRMGRYVFVIYRFLLWNTTFYLYELMWVCVCLNMRFVCISNMKLINDFIETWRIKVALPFMQLQSFWSVTCNVVSFHILVSFLFVSLPESVHVWNVISAK